MKMQAFGNKLGGGGSRPASKIRTQRNVFMSYADDAHGLRKSCASHSESNPDSIVTGFFMVGFPHVEISATLGRQQVVDNLFSGYWRAGEFQLLTPTELALGEYDESADDEEFEKELAWNN